MFCADCATQLPDGARHCVSCGAAVRTAGAVKAASAGQDVVPADLSESAPVAGWYVDPELSSGHRWWDGNQWTNRVQRDGSSYKAAGVSAARRQPEGEPVSTDPTEAILVVSAAAPRRLLDNPDWSVQLKSCTVLGGFGFPFALNDRLALDFDRVGLSIRIDPRDDPLVLPYAELRSLDIGGPGAVTTGGGFIGGGFGVDGAATGILVAGVLNTLTTRTKISTVLRLETNDGELFLLYTGAEPGAVRIWLSPVVVAMRRAARRPGTGDRARKPRASGS